MSEIEVRLPDGKTLSVPAGSTVLSVAERIGKGLARAALAGRVDGELVDLRVPIEQNAEVQIITAKSPEAGDVIRHSAEHVMADAVKRLFPGAQIDVGRADHSEKFQYDFLVEHPFTPEDLERIEAEMGKIIAEKSTFVREVLSREEARALFEEQGEDLKLSRLDDIPEGEEITVFRHGEFTDLCRGPHVQRTDQIGAFKLTEAAACVLAGRRAQPDAPADLRHRLPDREGARRAPRGDRGSPASRPPARGRGARALPAPPALAGLALLPAEGPGPLQHASSTTSAASTRSTATRR